MPGSRITLYSESPKQALSFCGVFNDEPDALAQAAGGPALELDLHCVARCLVALVPAGSFGASNGATFAGAGASRSAPGALAQGGNPSPDPAPSRWPELAARLAALAGVWLPDGFAALAAGEPPAVLVGPKAGCLEGARVSASRPAAEAPCVWVRLGALDAALCVALAVAGGLNSTAAPD